MGDARAAAGEPVAYADGHTTRRQRIAEEILSTERTYVEQLTTLQVVFLEPLRSLVGTPQQILSEKSLATLFSNLEDLVRLNKELLAALTARIETSEWETKSHALGDVFLRISPFLKLYSVYVSNYDTALATLNDLQKSNPQFAAFLKDCFMLKECQGLTFVAFLITPVQRIPRYKLLLQDFLKHTPEVHPDHPNLSKAYDMIAQIANYVNEVLRQQSNASKVMTIQKSMSGLQESLIVPGRRYIRDGVLQKVCRKSNKPRAFFLFSDALFYATVSSSVTAGAPQFTFHRKFELDTVRAEEQPDTETIKNAFALTSPEKSFLVFAETAELRDEWVHAINDAANVLRKNRATLRVSVAGSQASDEGTGADEEGASVASPKDSTRRKRSTFRQSFVAPVWVPDSEAPACMVCNVEFTVVRRRHHCRFCGKVTCGSCAPKRQISWLSSTEGVRICTPCYPKVFYAMGGEEERVEHPFGEDADPPNDDADPALDSGSDYESDDDDGRAKRDMPSAPPPPLRQNGDAAPATVAVPTAAALKAAENDPMRAALLRKSGLQAASDRVKGLFRASLGRSASSKAHSEVYSAADVGSGFLPTPITDDDDDDDDDDVGFRRPPLRHVEVGPRVGRYAGATTDESELDNIRRSLRHVHRRSMSVSDFRAGAGDEADEAAAAEPSASANMAVYVDSVRRSLMLVSGGGGGGATGIRDVAPEFGEGSPWSVEVSGFLLKRGLVNTSWKRRWFVCAVQRGVTVPVTHARIWYYKNATDRVSAGSIDLKNVLSVRVCEEPQDPAHRYQIKIMTSARVYVLGTDDFMAQSDWFAKVDSIVQHFSLAPVTRPPPPPPKAQQQAAAAAMSPDDVRKQGFLTKQGNRYKSWKVRWFVLTGRTLSYYKDSRDLAEPLGVIDLASVLLVEATASDEMGGQPMLSVITATRTYPLIAETVQDRDDWVRVLLPCVRVDREAAAEALRSQQTAAASGSRVSKLLSRLSVAQSPTGGSSSSARNSVARQ